MFIYISVFISFCLSSITSISIINRNVIPSNIFKNCYHRATIRITTSLAVFKNEFPLNNNNNNKDNNGFKKKKLLSNKLEKLMTNKDSRLLDDDQMSSKEKYAAQRTRIERLYSPNDRKKLSDFTLGEKLKGRIISITDYGLFVDIGAKKDGLVHIKDISSDYFVENIKSSGNFNPGDDIDVWIKFLDIKNHKLGLQLFPLKQFSVRNSINKSNVNIEPLNLEELSVEQSIVGTAVKFSNYGVYVDIGLPSNTLAFLHKRKMKINRRQRKYKPWEIVPLGSLVNGFVYEVDVYKGRVSLTTFSPDDWETMIPIPEDDLLDGEEDEDMVDDDEELGGSTRAANLRALERTLALSLDDDDDFDEQGEELSLEEIRNLTNDKNKKVLIDDFGDGPSTTTITTTSDNKVRKMSTSSGDVDEVNSGVVDEMTSEELFESISSGRPFVTLQDLKKWDYLSSLLKNEEIEMSVVSRLFAQSGGVKEKLGEDQFELFLENLADHLGLEEDDGSDDVEGEEEKNRDGKTILKKSFSNEDLDKEVLDDLDFRSVGIDDSYEDDDDEDIDISLDDEDDDDNNDSFLDLSDLDEVIDGASDLDLLREGKGKSSSYLQQSEAKNDILNNIYKSLAGKKQFVAKDDILNWDIVKAYISSGSVDVEQVNVLFDESCSSSKDKKMNKIQFSLFYKSLVSSLEKSNDESIEIITNEENKTETTDEYEEVPIETVFNELSSGKGFLTLDEISKWSLIKDLLDDELLSKDELLSMFVESGANDSLAVNFEGFEKFLDLLEPYADDETYDDESMTDEESKEESDLDLLENVYKGLARGKSFVSKSDLIEWDFVIDLFGEGVLTEDMLEKKVKTLSEGNKKGLTLDGFDKLIDYLVDLHKIAEQNSDDNSFDVVDNVERENNNDSNNRFIVDDSEEVDENLIEIDTLLEFNKLSDGADYIKFTDLFRLEFINSLIESNQITEVELRDIINSIGVKNDSEMDIDDFEAVLEELVIATGAFEDQPDEEFDNDEE